MLAIRCYDQILCFRVATRTKDSRVLPPAAAGDAGKKKKKNKFAKLKEKKKAATSTTWPPKRDPSSLRILDLGFILTTF